MPDNQYRHVAKKPSKPAPPVNALRNPKAEPPKRPSGRRIPEPKRPADHPDADMKIAQKRPKKPVREEDVKVYVKGEVKKSAPEPKRKKQNLPLNFDVDQHKKTDGRLGLWVVAIISLSVLCLAAAAAYLAVNGYLDFIIQAL